MTASVSRVRRNSLSARRAEAGAQIYITEFKHTFRANAQAEAV